MTYPWQRALVLAVLFAVGAAARAQDAGVGGEPAPAANPPEPAQPPEIDTTETVTTTQGAAPGVGFEEGVTMNALVTQVHHATTRAHAGADPSAALAAAEQVIDTILARFDGRMTDPATTYIVVADDAQVERWRAEHPGGGPVVRMDHSLRQALHLKAFVATARGDDTAALEWLDREIARAPYASDARCELGYLFNRRGDATAALAAYDEAARLAREFTSERDFLPIALRGRGFAMIELGRLSEARAAFEESLELDPGNAIAVSELGYIDELERGQTGSPRASGDPPGEAFPGTSVVVPEFDGFAPFAGESNIYAHPDGAMITVLEVVEADIDAYVRGVEGSARSKGGRSLRRESVEGTGGVVLSWRSAGRLRTWVHIWTLPGGAVATVAGMVRPDSPMIDQVHRMVLGARSAGYPAASEALP